MLRSLRHTLARECETAIQKLAQDCPGRRLCLCIERHALISQPIDISVGEAMQRAAEDGEMPVGVIHEELQRRPDFVALENPVAADITGFDRCPIYLYSLFMPFEP